MKAALCGHADCVKALIKGGAKLEARDKTGKVSYSDHALPVCEPAIRGQFAEARVP